MRRSELYVSRENRFACSIIARSEGSNVTADEVGDRLLSWALSQQFPALISLRKKQEALEAEMLTAVRKDSTERF